MMAATESPNNQSIKSPRDFSAQDKPENKKHECLNCKWREGSPFLCTSCQWDVFYACKQKQEQIEKLKSEL